MPRRCLCDRLRARLAADPRLVTLPMAAKYLWLALAERAATTPDGILRLGSEFGFLTGIAMLIQCAEPEVKTQLETLLARGVLRREGDDLVLPELAGAAPRASAARQNGARGGRPRAGETPEQARARRAQGHLALPIAGGGETQETHGATQPGSGTTTTSLNSIEVSRGERDETAAWVSLGEQVAGLAGLDPVRQRFDYRPVKDWLAKGASEELVLAAVAECIGRPSYSAGKVRSLGYFTPAIEARLAAGSPPPPMGPTKSGWAESLHEWVRSGRDASRHPTRAAWLAGARPTTLKGAA